MESSELAGAASRIVTRSEEAGDRQQVVGIVGSEGDAEVRVVVASLSRAEERGVEGLPCPGDPAVDLEEAACRQAKLDANGLAGEKALCGGNAQATQPDLGAPRERCDRPSGLGGESKGGVERDPS